jgi:hypothetical protein
LAADCPSSIPFPLARSNFRRRVPEMTMGHLQRFQPFSVRRIHSINGLRNGCLCSRDGDRDRDLTPRLMRYRICMLLKKSQM